jgi:hypothetical protein
MSWTTFLQRLRGASRSTGRALRPGTRSKAIPRRSFVPRLDVLEDRMLPSAVSFSPVVNYAVAANPVSVVAGDFNGDGKLDLAVASVNGGGLSVLQGNGDGTFQAARSVASGISASALAAGDFNGDGKLDLAVANSASNTVSILLGNGDGTFQASVNYAVGSQPAAVAVGDFNGDGKIDLAVANTNSNTVSVLLGNGDGSFQTAVSYAAGLNPQSVAMADFNNDGKADLVVADHGVYPGTGAGVSVLLGNGDGTFQAARSFAAGYYPTSVAVGDFNGDGKTDLAVADLPLDYSSGNVSVLLGNGDGTFQAAQNNYLGGSARFVAVGDFNLDGKTDLAVTKFGSAEADTVNVLTGNGDGTFQTPQSFRVAALPQPAPVAVAVGDFNGDGRPDLAVANFSGSVGVLLNQFATTTTVSGPTNSTYGQLVNYTATVTNGNLPVSTGTVTFHDRYNAISPPMPLNAAGQATFSIAALPPRSDPYLVSASYSGAPGGAGITPYNPSDAGTFIGLKVAPAPLAATAINITAPLTAGAPFSAAVAAFTNADPFDSAASYAADIFWGDGSVSGGTVSGTGTLTVCGSHTYADPGSYTLSVSIQHRLGYTTTAAVYPTTNPVTSLGLNVQQGQTGDIGFWHSNSGQALINSFNGGPTATALSSWLATSFPNLYGFLWGSMNADVAAFYQSQFALSGPKAEAQLLATALSIYATTRSLGGTAGQSYGFTVTDAGLGAYSFNVGPDGEAFGMANNSTHTVYAFLKGVDGDPWTILSSNSLRKQVNDLFDALDKAGAIS